MTVYEIITNEEIDIVWGHANFGPNPDKRKIIASTLLKCASGYASGSTARHIVYELGLVTKSWKLSKKGRLYLYAAFEKYVKS